MELDLLRYEVQRIDGTPDSVLRAIDLLIAELLKPDTNYLPKSIEYGFFEEFSKCLINWMGKGEFGHLKAIYEEIRQRIKMDDAFISPFSGGSSKKRFGAYLNILNDMIEVYLRSDMELKDSLSIMGFKANQVRQRKLLSALYAYQQPVFTKSEVRERVFRELYGDLTSKQLERDLDELAEVDFLRKEYESPRSINYRLTPKAYYWRTKIEESLVEKRAAVEVVFIPNFETKIIHQASHAVTASLWRKEVAGHA
jgi:hypothetical protein